MEFEEKIDLNEHIAEQLARLTEGYLGQRFLGVVDGMGCVEFVFSDDGASGNLLTLWFDDTGIVNHAHGFVVDPEGYAKQCRTKA